MTIVVMFELLCECLHKSRMMSDEDDDDDGGDDDNDDDV